MHDDEEKLDIDYGWMLLELVVEEEVDEAELDEGEEEHEPAWSLIIQGFGSEEKDLEGAEFTLKMSSRDSEDAEAVVMAVDQGVVAYTTDTRMLLTMLKDAVNAGDIGGVSFFFVAEIPDWFDYLEAYEPPDVDEAAPEDSEGPEADEPEEQPEPAVAVTDG